MFVWLSHIPASADHIHHLWYNNTSWQDRDLTALTHGGIPQSPGGVAAFYTTPNDQLHVFYVDSNSQHVHQLYKSKNWIDEDLTAFTGGPAASGYSITGFSIGNLQYVFYVSTDLHVHELNYNNVNWTDQDLTAVVGGNLADVAPIVAFATKPNNQLHVYYQATNIHVYQLYFNGTSWSNQDLTSTVGGAYCDETQWMAGFAVGNLQHIFCPGIGSSSSLDMVHIFYNNSSWVFEDVTVLAGGVQTPVKNGSGVAAFKVPGVSQIEAYGVTDDTHFHQYTHTVSPAHWTDSDLTTAIGAPTDSQSGGIVAFVTTPNNQYHVYYAPSTEVYQVYFNGTAWSIEDLTGGVGQADPNGGMAGFSIGNLQHVFYMSSGN